MKLPLEGIIVLDLSRLLPGPYCTMVLSDLGAEVIRIEDPSFPLAEPPPNYVNGSYNESAFNSILMRNKKSIKLNFKKEGARDLFYELVKKADIVMESLKPGTSKKLKVDYDTLNGINPSIIYCSLTGYGQTGPYKFLPGHDLNYQAISGFLHLNRPRFNHDYPDSPRDPIVPGIQSADIGGALFSVIGILGALIERDKNPEKLGQFIDISMLDSAFSMNPMEACHNLSNNPDNVLHGDFPFYSIYKAKDGKYLSLGTIEMKFWNSLCDALDMNEFKTKLFARGSEREEIFKFLENKFLEKTSEEWMDYLKEFDIPIMTVKTFKEGMEDPQINAREMIEELDHPKLGKIKIVGSPIKYSRTPLKIRSIATKAGSDFKEILDSFGYSDEEIKSFKKKGYFR